MHHTRVRVLSMGLFALLLVWGGIATLAFFGMPIHGRVLLSDAGWTFVDQVCGQNSLFCRGGFGLLPSLFHAIGRTAPFTGYVITLVLIALGVIGWRGYRYGDLSLEMRLRPWQVLVGFIGLTWLMFTVLTNVSYPQGDRMVSMRRLIEPHPSVYTSDNEEGLQMLQMNFESLVTRGCLRQTGTIRQDVGEYQISFGCVQQSFFTVVLPQMVFQLVLLLAFLALGRRLLRLLRIQIDDGFQEMVVSGGLGACGLIALLWVLAIFSIFTSSAGWLLLAAAIAIGYRDARYWLTRLVYDEFTVRRSWYSFTLLCGIALLSLLALNFLTVMRPFPIGWDDLGSYLNRPRLLVSYGSFISDMSTFQWEYLSALGYLLFGYDSIFGSTAAMTINWMAGLLATLAVMTFARRFNGQSGVIAGLLYYSLPMVGHFAFADMKTDNAVFLFQALSIFALFAYLFPQEDSDAQSNSRMWLVLSGIFCAFAFGTKATAVMVLFALGAILAGTLTHWSAFVAALATAFVVFVQAGAWNVREFSDRVGWDFLSKSLLAGFFGVVAVAFLAVTVIKNRKAIVPALGALTLLAVGFAAGIAPWLINNNIRAGNILPRPVLSAPNTVEPTFFYVPGDYSDVPNAHVLPEELAIDPDHAACVSTGRDEELGRYWGYDTGWDHYLTLPWRSVMNADSAGYYVTTTPVLLLFPLLLLLPFFWTDRGRWLRWLWIGTGFLVVQWVLLANGVPWYGIGMFLGFTVMLETLFLRAPDKLNRGVVVFLLVVGLVSCHSMRMWQFEQQKNLLEYPMGKASADVMRERTIPYYDDIIDVLDAVREDTPDEPYVYRIGTFIPYFIPRNPEVIGIVDHQLDEFNCLHQEQDDELTLRRLQALGFNSIIFDTNAATIEQDSDGPLHRKVQDFVDFVNNPALGLRMVVNDPSAGIAFMLLP